MTSQTMFDRVATHLLTQNKPARDSNGECRYRTKDGLKCAIGELIPDDKYDPDFEGAGGSALYMKPDYGDGDSPFTRKTAEIRKAAGFTLKQGRLAYALQSVHDEYEPKQWLAQLFGVAANFGLKTTVLEGRS